MTVIMQSATFFTLGNLLWWVLLGVALIIGGIVLILNSRDKQIARVDELEHCVEELATVVEELREKEYNRARREILAREKRAQRKADKHITLASQAEVDFYQSVRDTIDGL